VYDRISGNQTKSMTLEERHFLWEEDPMHMTKQGSPTFSTAF